MVSERRLYKIAVAAGGWFIANVVECLSCLGNIKMRESRYLIYKKMEKENAGRRLDWFRKQVQGRRCIEARFTIIRPSSFPYPGNREDSAKVPRHSTWRVKISKLAGAQIR